MPFTTPTFGLPYQLCSDRPCDSDGVWCDFVDVLEGHMIGFQNDVNRTSESIPLVKVSRSTPFLWDPATSADSGSDNVPWDVVEVDTDDMVDLEQNPIAIYPRRNGVYIAEAYGQTNTNTTVDNQFTFLIEGGGSPQKSSWSSHRRDKTLTPDWIAASGQVVWDSNSPFFDPSLGLYTPIFLKARYNGVPGPVISFFPISLTVYWVADI